MLLLRKENKDKNSDKSKTKKSQMMKVKKN